MDTVAKFTLNAAVAVLRPPKYPAARCLLLGYEAWRGKPGAHWWNARAQMTPSVLCISRMPDTGYFSRTIAFLHMRLVFWTSIHSALPYQIMFTVGNIALQTLYSLGVFEYHYEWERPETRLNALCDGYCGHPKSCSHSSQPKLVLILRGVNQKEE